MTKYALIVLVAAAVLAGLIHWFMNVSYGPMQATTGTVTARQYSAGSIWFSSDDNGNLQVQQYSDSFVTEISTPVGEYKSYSHSLYKSVVVGDRVAVQYRQRFWKEQPDKLVFEGARR